MTPKVVQTYQFWYACLYNQSDVEAKPFNNFCLQRNDDCLDESCVATRKQHDSGVEQEVLMDKCSGGKLGWTFFFFIILFLSPNMFDYRTVDGVFRAG